MAILSVALSILMVVLIRHVSDNIETYANAGSLVVRSIILLLGSGFVLGPLLAVMACVYVIAALFFPLEQVRGLLRYSFRHKLHDNIPD